MKNRFLKYAFLIFFAHYVTVIAIGGSPVPYPIPPVIGAWFWGSEQFEPEGYKEFIDTASKHSPYNLLTTGFRIRGRDITDIDVHNQVKQAVAYANEKGIKIALELDPRTAIRKFEGLYPDELQESLWLVEVPLTRESPVNAIVRSVSLNDHMTGSRTPYISLKGTLQRVYAYHKTAEGIDPVSLEEITERCEVLFSSSDSMVVQLPNFSGGPPLHACVMATYTHLAPDVFAPHLMEFTRLILESYSDIPLGGAMRDEWGFPPSFPADRMTAGNHFWYSPHYAVAYAEKTGGRELLEDCLLMFAGIKGKEGERHLATNHYMELNWQRNKVLEDDYYRAVKEFFGDDAEVVTHPTWYPYPNRLESKKNGLYWWVARRDWAQTDEITPFPVRTALSKKWNSAVWYNQYYSTERADYETETWSALLAGGRINYHPLYPSRKNRLDRHALLLTENILQAEGNVRLLNFISQSPLNCPVAVVFGHAATMNRESPSFEDIGVELANQLWQMGIPTDLIPTSEIEEGNLHIDENGWISYGPQRYAAVILYYPEFEKMSTARFFNEASRGQTQLFRVGDWTMDFNGRSFDGNAAFPAAMIERESADALPSEILLHLKKRGIDLQSPATRLIEGFGHVSNAPSTRGFARLIDGTLIQVSAKDNPSGDVIQSTMQIGEYLIDFDAVGMAAARLDEAGEVEALAAGGLKYFKAGDFIINLDERIDLALWKNDKGEIEGAIQGYKNEIPEQLLEITRQWVLLETPTAYNK